MNKEHTEQLFEKFPLIFPDRRFYFECGDGWYNIIFSACATIQSHINFSKTHSLTIIDFKERQQKVLSGDYSAIHGNDPEKMKFYSDPEKMQGAIEHYSKTPKWMETHKEIPQVVAVQIKEKFGTLRFYVDYSDEYSRGVIEMAENMSARTCETCGAEGTRRDGSWIRTLCDTHAEMYLRAYRT